jgi:sulfide dehydrogenase [flavocytochrome c] flavoprotein subunit
MSISRREFIRLLGAAGLGAGTGLLGMAPAFGAKNGGQVVIIGGGFGGATAAQYIRKLDPSISVTLVEANASYATCPGSNWVLGGLRTMSDITFNYDTLASQHGVKVVNDMATAIRRPRR